MQNEGKFFAKIFGMAKGQWVEHAKVPKVELIRELIRWEKIFRWKLKWT